MYQDFDHLTIKIEQFWDWFISHEYEFRNITDPDALKESLDNQVLVFGMFAWEIGLHDDQKYYLIISPNGNKERLKISKLIIDAAPPLSNWKFFYCKPPNLEWDFKIKIFDNFLNLQEIDASTWQFILKTGDDNKVNVLLNLQYLRGFEEEDLKIAADVACTNTLGEELKINHLCTIKNCR